MESPDVDTILEHLRVVSRHKRKLIRIASDIAGSCPYQALTLLSMVKPLTLSADSLLGDTRVG